MHALFFATLSFRPDGSCMDVPPSTSDSCQLCFLEEWVCLGERCSALLGLLGKASEKSPPALLGVSQEPDNTFLTPLMSRRAQGFIHRSRCPPHERCRCFESIFEEAWNKKSDKNLVTATSVSIKSSAPMFESRLIEGREPIRWWPWRIIFVMKESVVSILIWMMDCKNKFNECFDAKTNENITVLKSS